MLKQETLFVQGYTAQVVYTGTLSKDSVKIPHVV